MPHWLTIIVIIQIFSAGLGGILVRFGKNFISVQEQNAIANKLEGLWVWLHEQKAASFLRKIKNYKAQRNIALVTQIVFCFVPLLLAGLLFLMDVPQDDFVGNALNIGAFTGALLISWKFIPRVIRWVIRAELTIDFLKRSLMVSIVTAMAFSSFSIPMIFSLSLDSETWTNIIMFFTVFILGVISSVGNPFIFQTLFSLLWLFLVLLIIVAFKVLRGLIYRLSFGKDGYLAGIGNLIIIFGLIANMIIACYKFF